MPQPCRAVGSDRKGQPAPLRRPVIAVTGATGFIGRHLVPALAGQADGIVALARAGSDRGSLAAPNLHWVEGDLSDPRAIEALVRGAEVVVHLAGATKAPSRALFHKVNATATGTLVAAAARADVRHFIFLSSLAVQRPDVSDYAASKAAGEAEALAHSGTMPLSILRAPAVFGPGDGATLPLFSLIARGWLPVPGGQAGRNRFSVVDVEDLCRDIVALIAEGPAGDDPRSPYSVQSLGWTDIAAASARVLGRAPRRLVLPGPVLRIMGHAADLAAAATGRPQVFSSGKVREMASGDWIAATPVRAPTSLDATLARCLAPLVPATGPGLPVQRTTTRSSE